LKSSGLAGRFECNKPQLYFCLKGPAGFVACEKDLGQGAHIFMKMVKTHSSIPKDTYKAWIRHMAGIIF
jgi:hypothetical protein